jgi:hypothetical protein
MGQSRRYGTAKNKKEKEKEETSKIRTGWKLEEMIEEQREEARKFYLNESLKECT